MFRDDYHGCTWGKERVIELLAAYRRWCEANDEKPEVCEEWELGNPSVMAHVAYHGLLQETLEWGGRNDHI